MSIFCLVHGSTLSPSGWARLVPELEKRGHRVICADLPTDNPDANAMRYAQSIMQSVRHTNKAPIVLAHSVSGIFLPLMPAQCPVRAGFERP
jgi:hypothetical protein